MDVDSRWRVSEASAAAVSVSPEPVEIPGLNPWRTMWLSPRRTVRSLVITEERPSWIPVVALAGLNASLLSMLQAGGEIDQPVSAFAFALFRGGLQLVYGVLISPFIIALIAGRLGAEADADDVRLGIAWAYLPMAATLVLWLPLFIMFGWDAVRLKPETQSTAQALSVLLYMPIGLSSTYSLVLQVGGVAAALRASLLRTFFILLIPAIPALLLLSMFR